MDNVQNCDMYINTILLIYKPIDSINLLGS
jgi:hypothetical protein